MLHVLGNVAVWGSLLGEVAFIALFGFRSRWWTSWVGRYLFQFSTLYALLLASAVVAPWFGRPSWLQTVGLLALCGMTVMTWWRVVMLVRVQGQERRSAAREASDLVRLQAAILNPDATLERLRQMVRDRL